MFLAVNGIVQYHTGVGLGNVTMTLDRIYGTGIFNDPERPWHDLRHDRAVSARPDRPA